MDFQVVPPQYMRWCRKMQSDVPTEYSASEIRSVVEKSFGKKLEEIFKEWDDKPIGAASIGQAHRAVLHDGTVVAVKVRHIALHFVYIHLIKSYSIFFENLSDKPSSRNEKQMKLPQWSF